MLEHGELDQQSVLDTITDQVGESPDPLVSDTEPAETI